MWQTRFEIVPPNSKIEIGEDFLGMHLHRYPIYTTLKPGFNDSQLPKFQFASIRSHDADFGFWRNINTAKGVFDWSKLDAAASLGRPILWTMYGTPQWAASATDQGFFGPYGKRGESGVPVDMADVAAFTTSLVARYNTGGKRKIKWIELGNEPNFNQNRNGFWWGSASDLVRMGKVVRDAAKAVDPDILILSPGFVDVAPAIAWLAAVDPVSGKKGSEIIDLFSFHPYTSNYDAPANELRSAIPWFSVLKPLLLNAGIPDIGIVASEWAFNSIPENRFLVSPQWARKQWLKRNIAIHACLGIKATFLYSYNSNLIGNLENDKEGVIAAINESMALCGKTIVHAFQDYGKLTLKFSDASEYVV